MLCRRLGDKVGQVSITGFDWSKSHIAIPPKSHMCHASLGQFCIAKHGLNGPLGAGAIFLLDFTFQEPYPHIPVERGGTCYVRHCFTTG